jgi:LytS/YehU family sensor histidine kinase
MLIYWANIIYIYISLGVYLAFKHFNERARLLQIANTQRELELKQLTEQLNPHFLFNALNNIYSHQISSSPGAGELILKLSELMRYILDSSKKKIVPLNEEISFIEHYIAFEIERLGARCNLQYQKEIRAAHFNIVPLILFNFIENAFKHGTKSIHCSNILIRVTADENLLQLIVSNSVSNSQPHGMAAGIGMDNTKRRLELLYPGAHELDICSQADQFSVTLEIKNVV